MSLKKSKVLDTKAAAAVAAMANLVLKPIIVRLEIFNAPLIDCEPENGCELSDYCHFDPFLLDSSNRSSLISSRAFALIRSSKLHARSISSKEAIPSNIMRQKRNSLFMSGWRFFSCLADDSAASELYPRIGVQYRSPQKKNRNCSR